MRVLVTGAAGMLGQDVCAAGRESGHEIIPMGRAQLDITDETAVGGAVRAARPDVVVNCAAWTDVDGAEAGEEAAEAVNGAGAGLVAAAAARAGAWTLHISSDYVFDGSGVVPYVESDPVAPISAYGRTKLAGERAVASLAPERHTIVRSAWLFGSGGRCFPATIMRLAREREQLTVVDDQVGCPTFTGHLAHGLLELLASGPPPGVVHLAGGGHCSWFQFATEIVASIGADCRVVPGSSAELSRPAPRPGYSVLGSKRGGELPPMPSWREGLADYLSVVAARAPGARADAAAVRQAPA